MSSVKTERGVSASLAIGGGGCCAAEGRTFTAITRPLTNATATATFLLLIRCCSFPPGLLCSAKAMTRRDLCVNSYVAPRHVPQHAWRDFGHFVRELRAGDEVSTKSRYKPRRTAQPGRFCGIGHLAPSRRDVQASMPEWGSYAACRLACVCPTASPSPRRQP